ncbi:3-phosphoshikimate 1-carboxyvinyltransferase [Aurantibacillus circumpalustris]|uniref:3-phosphoshikimate 1-carboxyvinyltransferase n=1 Tax=Aurantibacillus circumpalustris TaxID=3036359 RepID=UPI00295C1423|nr:3-phosphoshikimate 1-carboxyvinyltransferase [Aurantibacillus circumpalustris]
MIRLTAPSNIIKANIAISGSKSISNRLLILKEALNLDITFQNISNSEDTLLLERAIEQIKNKKQATIDVQHAGTDMRFLTALLATKEGQWTITGSERMKERPIGELIHALRLLGADISYLEKENFPPLLIKGKKLKGGEIEIDSSVSSQFVSALLLIAPSLEKGLNLTLKRKTVSRPYIDMTIELIKSLGITITQKEDLISITPSSIFHHTPDSYRDYISIESDWSSASYWYSICALTGNAEIELSSLNKKSSQADSILPEIYKNLGVKTTFEENTIVLHSIKPTLSEFTYDFTDCPDIAQTIAVTCLGLGIKINFTGLSTLKVKETDRVIALKNELEKFGAVVEIGNDFLKVISYKLEVKRLVNESLTNNPITNNVSPNNSITNNLITYNVSTYNDHRMAMSFAPLASVFTGLCIENHSVVDKSYPAFWEDLKSVGFNVNLQP